MSDTEQREDKKSKGDTREKALVEPVPKRRDFFEWLESLFDGTSQFPEKLELRVVEGKKLDRYGELIEQIVYLPNAVKPSTEKVVALSNKLLSQMQLDCDEQRREVVYGVFAWHFSRESEPYKRFIVRCKPDPKLSRGHESNGYGEDDVPMSDRFSVQVLGHQERMVGLLGAGYEGMLDRDDRTIDRLLKRIESLEDKNARLVEQLERALSLEDERKTKIMWESVKVKGVERSMDMFIGMAPSLINTLVGRQVLPSQETPETVQLKNYFKSKEEGGILTEEQSEIVFGRYSESPPHDTIKRGVLTIEQSKILHDVAFCYVSSDELDKLMPGGPNEITMDQITLLVQSGLTMDQLAPLHMLFQERLKKRSQG